MNKAVIIFNPTAGILTKQDIRGLTEEKLRSLGYEPRVILLNGDYEKNIAGQDFSEVGLFVAVGGDGTVKVAARTLIENNLKVPLAIIPFGSANVVANTLNIPLNLKDALKLLEEPRAQAVDVGLINKRQLFLVGFSLGYVSHIIISTEKELKNRFGHFGYLVKLFFNKIRIARIKFKIETRQKTYWIKGNSLIIFNAFNYFGFRPKKEIKMDDGLFNLYVVTNKTFWTMFEAAVGVLFYTHPPKHIFSLDGDWFRLSLVRKKRYLNSCQIDGDRLNLSNNMEIEVLPRAIEILVKK